MPALEIPKQILEEIRDKFGSDKVALIVNWQLRSVPDFEDVGTMVTNILHGNELSDFIKS